VEIFLCREKYKDQYTLYNIIF